MNHSARLLTLLQLCLGLSLCAAAMETALAQPVIKSIAPTSGAAGTIVTITGSGLGKTTRGWVGSGHNAGIAKVSARSVRITVPANASTGLIALNSGGHWAFSPVTFTFHGRVSTAAGGSGDPTSTLTSPVIAAISPLSGPAGTKITVTGTGLQPASTAWVGAGHDAAVTAVSATKLTVTVPADASSGAIALQIGSHWAFSTAAFVLTGKSASTTSSGSGSGSSTNSGPISPPNPALAVHVQGNHLIDASGNNLQLRGVNISDLEFVAIAGWSPNDPWGGGAPNWNAIRSWHANAVRIPLNEASWLGYTCTDVTGAARNPDPGGNYRDTVAHTVGDATAAGLYVIIDLHWTAPSTFCPLGQNEMADTEHSNAFWTSVATQFKSYPNVLFELFNEPFFYYIAPGQNAWAVLQNGGTSTQYVTGGSPYTAKYTWTSTGMQQMLDTVRATGATNVILVGTNNWSSDLSQWLTYMPSDQQRQMAAVWHAYPASKVVGDPNASLPGFGAIAYTWAEKVLAAGIPVVITETGDHDTPGTVGAPFVSKVLPWADAHDVSYFGWTWDVWQDPDYVLIKDAAGTPTDGYGQYFQQHLLCVSAGNPAACP